MWNDHRNHHRRRAVRTPVEETALIEHVSATHRAGTLASPNVTVFRCVNCSRPGAVAASPDGRRPSQREPDWPFPVHEVALPCTGRLQPEHLLKAFEAGADAVCVIACGADSCHYLEGSRRAERRAEYVRELLDEIGLGGERLVIHLAASEELGSRLAAIREMVAAGIGALQPNPLRRDGTTI